MIKRNLIANYLGQGWTALMGLAFVPFYIKYLGSEAYGLIGLFAVLTAWLSLLDMGMTPMIGREMACFTSGRHSIESIRDLLRSIEIIALGIALLVAGSVALAATWISTNWLQTENLPVDVVAKAFTVMGMATALRFVEGIYRSCVVGLQRQVLFNIVSSIMATLRWFGAVAVLAWVSPTITAFFFWQGLVSIVTLGTLAMTTYMVLPPASRRGRFSLAALRGVWQFAAGTGAMTFLSLLLSQVDKILLSRLLKLTEFSHYTLAATVASVIFLLIAPITQAWYPRLCELHSHNDQKELTDTYHAGAQLVSVVGGSVAIVLFLFSEIFLKLWTQNAEFAQRAAPLLRLLLLGNLLNGLIHIPYQTQLAHGWTTLMVRINLVAVLIIVPAILWATPRYGAEGAAWAWAALNSGYVLVWTHFMHRRILPAEKWRWYRQDVAVPLVTALAMASVVKLAGAKFAFASDLILLILAAIVTLGVSALSSNYLRNKMRVMVTISGEN